VASHNFSKSHFTLVTVLWSEKLSPLGPSVVKILGSKSFHINFLICSYHEMHFCQLNLMEFGYYIQYAGNSRPFKAHGIDDISFYLVNLITVELFMELYFKNKCYNNANKKYGYYFHISSWLYFTCV
jgi:hypothetical protein